MSDQTPAPLDEARLAGIEARAQAAPAGAWFDSATDQDFDGYSDHIRRYMCISGSLRGAEAHLSNPQPESLIPLIVHARADILGLVAEVRRVRARAAGLESALKASTSFIRCAACHELFVATAGWDIPTGREAVSWCRPRAKRQPTTCTHRGALERWDGAAWVEAILRRAEGEGS